jgi:hypothetical protein
MNSYNLLSIETKNKRPLYEVDNGGHHDFFSNVKVTPMKILGDDKVIGYH